MNRNVLGFITFFSLLSMIVVIFAVVLWGTNQDYVLYEINEVSRSLESDSLITSEIANTIEADGNRHAGLIDFFDWWWFASYVFFFGSTIIISYFSKSESEFGFLGMLFYGTMVLLFLLSLLDVMTTWLSADVLYKLIPNLDGSFPKLDFVTANIGIISLIQMLICIFVNKMDFNLLASKGKKLDARFENSGEVV